MIHIKNLHKTFGKITVLKELDLDIQSKGIFAILGPNGSGKTTLIKSILGMVIPDKGTIKINDKDILKKHTYRNNINYLPQIANFPENLTVSELIQMIKDVRTKEAVDSGLIELFGLQPFLKQKLGNLSGGTKQKVNLVLTFMFNSDLIILDEPTTGLDPISLLHLKELIKWEKEKGKTILITSHIMSFVEEMSDEIVFLLDGKIHFKGKIEQLKEQTNQTDLEHAIANILTKEHV
ncbi:MULTISPECIES: ABC transporter ATP-binding protein [unclassified Tenacibaculum]|uniref:ABC transporter ATP-binding protein n=1 Tax=unclassified Tenacibaculum TaxID=2635139 RepID=UPI001F431D4F|nr:MULTISPECIES: ABC transporter ATP-binding protein [unclassified Tenacibaculum]MCF2875854.1 ABC transporter ATP-binding protein [Tenacibaculum sp. Cn5-1]MCF2935929.1 ABC transporter ATP-binding protein [Tenacibaculum sp. Cn5-34]MCG7512490.1 ABC transporter ATP-binding protein [Tenacibaculum sp. Cn5-46]